MEKVKLESKGLVVCTKDVFVEKVWKEGQVEKRSDKAFNIFQSSRVVLSEGIAICVCCTRPSVFT